MAMTSGPDPLPLAMAELRLEADRWWARVAPRVRARALQADGRRAVPAGVLRAQAPGGPVTVACAVLVAQLARAVGEVPGVEPDDVLLDLGPGDPADLLGVGLVVTLTAAALPAVLGAPEPLQELGSRLARLVAARLRELLGPVLPEPVEQLVRVHVEDLTGPRGDG